MSICSDCDIEYKLEQCCGAHPETGESVPLEMNEGIVVYACPDLGPDGSCKNYHERPDPCKSHYCPDFNKLDLVQLMQR